MILTLLSSVILICSCRNKRYTDEIIRMQSHPLDMTPCENAFCCEEGKKKCYDDAAYKLIIYVDSISCSQCLLSHMTDYMGTIVDFESVGIKTLFIFEPGEKQAGNVISSLLQMALPIQTIVVQDGSFTSNNPHLPSTPTLHSFLLNKNNEVIVVGNPIYNDRIKRLMLDYVEDNKRTQMKNNASDGCNI